MSEAETQNENASGECNVRSSDLSASGQQDADLPCNELCRKCGSDDVLREFLKAGNRRERPGIHRAEPTNFEYPSECSYRAVAKRDFLFNKCRCCGYEWGSKPMTPAAWKKRANASSTAKAHDNHNRTASDPSNGGTSAPANASDAQDNDG